MNRPRFNVMLRVLVINAHVGIALRNGLLQACFRRWPWVNCILACEVRDGAVLRRVLGSRWHVVPYEQPYEARNKEAMTYVCLKNKKRWVLLDSENRVISLDPYPRRLTAVSVLDRWSGRVFNLSSLHVDPLGKGFVNAHPSARAKHGEQVQEYADWHQSKLTPTTVDVAGGDWNEGLRLRHQLDANKKGVGTGTARHRFSRIRMVPAHAMTKKNSGPIALLETFVRRAPHVTVVRREAVKLPRIKGLDHEVVMTWVKVKKLPR